MLCMRTARRQIGQKFGAPRKQRLKYGGFIDKSGGVKYYRMEMTGGDDRNDVSRFQIDS